MIVKYKGTDAHGKFVMGRLSFPNRGAMSEWLAKHRDWPWFMVVDTTTGEEFGTHSRLLARRAGSGIRLDPLTHALSEV